MDGARPKGVQPQPRHSSSCLMHRYAGLPGSKDGGRRAPFEPDCGRRAFAEAAATALPNSPHGPLAPEAQVTPGEGGAGIGATGAARCERQQSITRAHTPRRAPPPDALRFRFRVTGWVGRCGAQRVSAAARARMGRLRVGSDGARLGTGDDVRSGVCPCSSVGVPCVRVPASRPRVG